MIFGEVLPLWKILKMSDYDDYDAADACGFYITYDAEDASDSYEDESDEQLPNGNLNLIMTQLSMVSFFNGDRMNELNLYYYLVKYLIYMILRDLFVLNDYLVHLIRYGKFDKKDRQIAKFKSEFNLKDEEKKKKKKRSRYDAFYKKNESGLRTDISRLYGRGPNFIVSINGIVAALKPDVYEDYIRDERNPNCRIARDIVAANFVGEIKDWSLDYNIFLSNEFNLGWKSQRVIWIAALKSNVDAKHGFKDLEKDIIHLIFSFVNTNFIK